MSIYELYWPLRNDLKRLSLVPSLRVIWAWIQHFQFEAPIPGDIEAPDELRANLEGPQRIFFEWELGLLAKQLLANAPLVATPRDLRTWETFRAVVNRLKELDNSISGHYEELFRQNVLVEMYRSAHRQFPWQRTATMQSEAARYFKIFSTPEIDAIVRRRLGMSVHTLYTVGLSLAGMFLTASDASLPLTTDLRDVGPEEVGAFFRAYVTDIGTMREQCIALQSFDENFVYAPNPLVKFPVVAYTINGVPTIAAPVPTFLLRRFTQGVYYDVLGSPGFDVAFGEAFQRHVGEVLHAADSTDSLAVLPEREYHIGRDRKDSVDWIASDSTGDLFIECKTKRLPQKAKLALADLAPLQAELGKLTEFVVQIYKTLSHALEGRYPHWQPTDRPVYPLVVTLEEWYVFGDMPNMDIDRRVRAAFRESELDETLLDRHPYTVCSAEEFERLIPLVVAIDIRRVMEQKLIPERRHWLLHTALLRAFPQEYTASRAPLFPHALDSITGGGS